MFTRSAALAALMLLISGCATDGGPNNAFDIVDTNYDGQVDLEEFRRQTLFPVYEQFFHEANDDGDATLDPEEFAVAQSQVYNAMGVGGVEF